MATTTTTLDLPFSEDQQMIREAVAEFVAGEVQPAAVRTDADSAYPGERIAQYAELGLFGIPFPEAAGGGDGDATSAVLAIEEVSRACASTAYLVALQTAGVAWPLWKIGGDRFAEALGPLLMGETLGALAHDETTPGSLATIATPEGDGYTLTGAKPHVGNGPRAAQLLVTARHATNADQIVVAWIDASAAGVSRGERRPAMGLRGVEACDIQLANVAVAAADVVGVVDAGQLSEAFALWTASLATISNGVASAALANATDYAQARRQFDTPLATFPAIRFKLSAARTGLHASRLLAFDAARRIDANSPAAEVAAMARAAAGDAATKTTYDAIQVYGGNGYSREYPLERHWRDAKALASLSAGLEFSRFAVASSLLAAASQ